MDADYKAADIEDIIKNADSLNKVQKDFLRIFLNKYKELFDGSLGNFDIPSVKLEVNQGTEPEHTRPFPVPHIYIGKPCTKKYSVW